MVHESMFPKSQLFARNGEYNVTVNGGRVMAEALSSSPVNFVERPRIPKAAVPNLVDDLCGLLFVFTSGSCSD